MQRAGGCVPSRNKDVDGNGRGSRAGAEPDECPRLYRGESRTSGGTREVKPFVPALELFRIPPQGIFQAGVSGGRSPPESLSPIN